MANNNYTYSSPRRAVAFIAWQIATSRYVLIPLLIISLILAGVLVYYYNRYTLIINAGLRGDLFVRSSGIYAAPLTLYSGSSMRINTLVAHLRQVGYLDRTAPQNEKRGQFTVNGSTIEILPGSDALIDGGSQFRNLRVVFGRDGSVIQSITDNQSRQQIPEAQVEPELISSVINQDREKRKIIEFKDIPKDLLDAIISIEDRQFFEHPGVNWRGILRALIRDYQAGEFREGGSSITQQLVKNLFIYKPHQVAERKLSRKLGEAYMSIILEQRLSKEEIMAMYCNQIYLGQRGSFSINGFGQAARAYFGKDISNLTLAESATLAGIIRSPNYYSPVLNQRRAQERRNLVLEKMVEASKVNRAEAEASKRLDLGVTGKADGIDASDAPYFVDYLMRQLEGQVPLGEPLNSLRIYSTIDLELQRAGYQAVVNNMKEVEKLFARRKGGTAGLQAALVAMNPKTGEILAMVGGRDYQASQLNRATDAKRQPGSVFKPFVYATALTMSGEDQGVSITPASMFRDEPISLEFDGKTYDPGNFNEKYEMRPVTVRDALVHSKNVVAVQVAEQIGYSHVSELAKRAGLTNIPPYPSAALGVGEATPLQMSSAYTIFANQGKHVAPVAIKRVTTKDGAVLLESETKTRQVISPQVAYIMTSMMSDVLSYGTGTRVRQMGFTAPAAGKTGSSRDGWFAGYTPNLVCVVWVGFDDNSDIKLTGGVTAAPIWADFMTKALRARPELGGQFKAPEDGLVTYDIDPLTGSTEHTGSAKVRHEIFLKGTEPGSGRSPDSLKPDPELPPPTARVEIPPTLPEPKRPNVEPKLTPSGNEDNPHSPEARRRSSKENPQSEPEEKKNRSIFRKLSDSLGITSNDSRSNPPPSQDNRAQDKKVERKQKDDDEVASQGPAFLIEVCEKTGLLPAEKVCKKTKQRRFQLGKEPTIYCTAELHR